MAENRIGEGVLVTFENCTAYSNIAAGTPVAIISAAAAGGGTQITTLGDNVAGFSSTAEGMGYHFIGILDENVSAGDSPVTVWTEGVFRLHTSTGSVKGNVQIGFPVFGNSGNVVSLGVPGSATTGEPPIGTLVGLHGCSGTTTGSSVVSVRIKPAIYRWTIYNSGIAANTSATAPEALCWPKQGA